MSMLELRKVTAGYGHFTALWDVDLTVASGEAVAVVGPNGAGKTTLMRVVSGDGPCNADRTAHRRRAHAEGAWVRAAAAAYATKKEGKR